VAADSTLGTCIDTALSVNSADTAASAGVATAARPATTCAAVGADDDAATTTAYTVPGSDRAAVTTNAASVTAEVVGSAGHDGGVTSAPVTTLNTVALAA